MILILLLLDLAGMGYYVLWLSQDHRRWDWVCAGAKDEPTQFVLTYFSSAIWPYLIWKYNKENP